MKLLFVASDFGNQIGSSGTSVFAARGKSGQKQAPMGLREVLPERYWCLQMG